MIEDGVSGGICHVILRTAKANNKYVIYHDEKKRNIIYFIFRCKQSPVYGFKWVKKSLK